MTKRTALLAFLTAGIALAANAKPITFELPAETSAFRPGPNLEIAQGNCGSCHSADYLATQPTGPKFKKDFWQAETTKMIKVYGAPIEEKDIPAIVEYLTTAY